MGFHPDPEPAVRSLVVAKGGWVKLTPRSRSVPVLRCRKVRSGLQADDVSAGGDDRQCWCGAADAVCCECGSGPPVEIGADPKSVFRDTGADGAGTGYVGDVFLVGQPGDVSALLLGFEELSSESWRLGFRNIDPATDRDSTWVDADNPPDVIQPWVEVRRFTYRTAAIVSVRQPRDIVVDPILRAAYVTRVDFDGQATSHDVTVIDMRTHSVSATIDAGSLPGPCRSQTRRSGAPPGVRRQLRGGIDGQIVGDRHRRQDAVGHRDHPGRQDRRRCRFRPADAGGLRGERGRRHDVGDRFGDQDRHRHRRGRRPSRRPLF